MNFETIALHVPSILLPKQRTDMTRWAVVACDQFTSQPEYWEQVKKFVGDTPSTLHLILPELYLEAESREQMIRHIIRNMRVYGEEGILVQQKAGFILVDRKTSHAVSRKGLIVALDLEHYDFREGSQTLIRATEGTIVDRLPPRIQVREQAVIELPHIMVLIDDPEKTVIEPLFHKHLEKIYDFELMMQSGHIRGYHITDETLIREIADNITRLADPETFNAKYNVSGRNILLYAMGDGNHSLATAKVIWETLKKNATDAKSVMSHPARYALVELINLHDEGLEFESIHRVVFNIDAGAMLKCMDAFYRKQGSTFSYRTFATEEALRRESGALRRENVHLVSFVTQSTWGVLIIENPSHTLEVGSLQAFLDSRVPDVPGAKIDYIHGTDVLTTLGQKADSIGFYLPALSKQTLFTTIILDGALPRKTFSMGEADEKRFYLEGRKITLDHS